MKIQVLALTMAAGMAIALPASAKDRNDNAIFCATIGLAQADQATCTKQLANVSSTSERDYVQANWVARSAMINDVAAGRLPVLGNSPVDGRAGTFYQNDGFVPNRVALQINRAISSVLSNPAMKQIASAEQTKRR